MATFKAVLIFFAVGLIGFTVVARRRVPEDIHRTLTPLVLDIGLPSLVFFNIMTRFEPSAIPNWWQIPLIWMAFTTGTVLFTLLVRMLVNKTNKPEFSLSLLYPNSIFLPLTILPSIYGVDTITITYLFIFTLLFPAFAFNTYWLFFKKTPQNKFDLSKAINPILIATVLAIILKKTGTSDYVPGFIIELSRFLGMITLPLVMIMVGGSIYMYAKKSKFVAWRSLVYFVLTKNIILPVIVIFVLSFFELPEHLALIMVMISAAPPISAAPIFVEKAGGNTALANQYLLASFVACLVTMPVVLWIFSQL
ncbi:AEC family transporter [bacterium]|nr:AEC family transporter [bacterium]MBU1918258.1 AEC family transporter [bacterium]